MEKLATKDCIKWICTLLESEHALMVNDGLLALTLLATLGNGRVQNSAHPTPWANLQLQCIMQTMCFNL